MVIQSDRKRDGEEIIYVLNSRKCENSEIEFIGKRKDM